ncbi:diguanylate cyclase domain-containing protein [Paenibacillus hexagrammi]|uniref:Diguanylate cyclase n=1 Tax=Paenibacillus hexagrammi TaxID=2908839 RepID=A0ABY3SCU2_9BACL|nr:diguanylate cyclase [Paenibacillus sp. YPD9-1]UJF31818.1 diguanylate cyclase [Paenibacillus sp. YPD9-1]
MVKKIIGVLTPLTDGFYFNNMLKGIHDVALDRDAHIVHFQTYDSSHQNHYFHYLGIDYIDGWIVLLDAVSDPVHIKRLESMNKPIITTPYKSGFTTCTTFVVNNEQGGYDAASHMIQHGHRSIAFVYASSNEESIQRYEGYLRALEENGIPFQSELIYDVKNLWEKYGGDAVQLMQQRGFGFTALIASADRTAVGIMEAFRMLGIRVPEDISVCSFDNTEYASHYSLTSVAQPLYERGKRMAELLLNQIDEALVQDQVRIEKMEIVFRQSCGCKLSTRSDEIDALYLRSLQTVEVLSSALQNNYLIGRTLIKSNPESIRDLSWLSLTSFTWGCLALWEGEKTLRIESIYSTEEYSLIQINQTFQEGAFPPLQLQKLVESNESLIVHTIRTESKDMGFLVLIGDMFEKHQSSNVGPLIHSVTHTMDLLAAALERENLYEQIHKLAFHDPLTSIPNRRYIYDQMAPDKMKSEGPFAVLMIDLDRFKDINDSLGHLVGDKLLCKVAEILKVSAGPKDIVARLGGDEFIILCALEDQNSAEKLAESIISTLNEPLQIDSDVVRATPSIGISHYPNHGMDRETLIKHADIALYEAKEGGKNRFVVYQSEMNPYLP